MSRVPLAKLPSLTFYKDERTLSRRGKPIPQLACIGHPCRLFQPDVVRCRNAGGSGTEIDWKCEADLPDSMRFGRVEVSCEGWDGPGDSHVMKGSCALEYRLVQLPKSLRGGDEPSYPARFWQTITRDPATTGFMLLWLAVLGIILYGACCTSRRNTTDNNSAPQPRPPRGPGWFSGGGGLPSHPTNNDTPPPYSKYPQSQSQSTAGGGWRPGFWSGAALGWLGNQLAIRRRTQGERVRVPGAYDWEGFGLGATPATTSSSWWGGAGPSTSSSASRRRQEYNSNNDDRGEGPSDLGRMRTSVGLGGSSVR